VEITISLRDTEDGRVRIEEIRRPGPDETEQSVTAAMVLAEEMLLLLDDLGETEASELLRYGQLNSNISCGLMRTIAQCTNTIGTTARVPCQALRTAAIGHYV
jgi:hypothetical protein